MWVSRLQRRRDEDGFALPVALGVLIMCVIITAIIVSYTSSGELASTKLATERNNVYAAEGAINAAIKWAQADTTHGRGASSDSTCLPANGSGATTFFTTTVNNVPVPVTCTSASDTGGVGDPTTQPAFAILSLSPYHGASPNGGGTTYPTCVNVHDELGIVQSQHSQLVQVYGNVYVNADVDADWWQAGCPFNPSGGSGVLNNATPIVVYGNVIERESNHDFCAGNTIGGVSF
jgi:hypothetical protein